MDKYDPTADYVVFDDVKIKYLTNFKSWLGCGGEFEASDKYRAKRTINWVGKCCIVLCNTGASWDWRYSDEWKDDPQWFEGNVKVVVLDKPLY